MFTSIPDRSCVIDPKKMLSASNIDDLPATHFSRQTHVRSLKFTVVCSANRSESPFEIVKFYKFHSALTTSIACSKAKACQLLNSEYRQIDWQTLPHSVGLAFLHTHLASRPFSRRRRRWRTRNPQSGTQRHTGSTHPARELPVPRIARYRASAFDHFTSILARVVFRFKSHS